MWQVVLNQNLVPFRDPGQFVPLINLRMKNHIKLTSGYNSNSYIRQFQVAQLNFYLFNQEEKMQKRGFRLKYPASGLNESR